MVFCTFNCLNVSCPFPYSACLFVALRASCSWRSELLCLTLLIATGPNDMLWPMRYENEWMCVVPGRKAFSGLEAFLERTYFPFPSPMNGMFSQGSCELNFNPRMKIILWVCSCCVTLACYNVKPWWQTPFLFEAAKVFMLLAKMGKTVNFFLIKITSKYAFPCWSNMVVSIYPYTPSEAPYKVKKELCHLFKFL